MCAVNEGHDELVPGVFLPSEFSVISMIQLLFPFTNTHLHTHLNTCCKPFIHFPCIAAPYTDSG